MSCFSTPALCTLAYTISPPKLKPIISAYRSNYYPYYDYFHYCWYENENRGRRLLEMGERATLCSCRARNMTMRDRSKNRKPLQRGRILSIEAIQTVQALKRAKNKINKRKLNDGKGESQEDSLLELEQVIRSKVRRMLKLDMMAVLHELLRQKECLLALKVFEDVRKEYWYKPQVSLYAEMISVLGSNGLFEKVEFVFMLLKMESSFVPDTDGFNALLESLMSFSITDLAMESFDLMKAIGCEPDEASFRILINGLESNGETSLSALVRQEAEKFYGKYINFQNEGDAMLK